MLKKAVLFLFVLLTVSSLWAQNVPAGLEYQTRSDSAIITRYTGAATTLIIPAQIQGLPVTDIGYGAFQSSSLTSITIPSSVTFIGNLAFSACDYLTSITIPSSVFYIGTGAFAYCGALADIIVDSNNSRYISIDGILFDRNIRTIIAFPAGKTTRIYSIPSTVTAISDYAFCLVSRLTSITIPSSVTSIGDFAFAVCRDLSSITIPSSVTSIGDGAFGYCVSLNSITLSRRTQVGENAFPEAARIIYSD